ncbi:M56 family metallopeptidase [Prolixibacteraceae bacterium Z1-6]|uniref:M56 family metallopeptidase n=1 Tax=Draconibacterium aestuarii TaxID=2998507 RepID=A0A9X3J7R2_9BACT|nr:M56 family metallopeptidase [Prolixibacteraceae bacterium Z1-6]
MNNLVNFIIESGISLSLLSLIYILFLRKETFFRLNRIFLLISVLFSMLLPFLKFRIYHPKSILLEEVTVTPYRNLVEAVTIYGQDLSGAVIQTISSSRIIIFIYLGGLLCFLARLVLRLIQISILIYGNPVRQIGGVKFVHVNKKFSPFSFLGYIFLNPEKRREPGYEKIVAHEMEHIKQGHSIDVLILEIMTIIQWFNPFMWILKRVIRENHEFLADRAVLNSGISTAQYKQLLLSQAVGFQFEMANNFNTSMVKNRIKMISQIRSSKFANLKFVLGILTAAALVVAFACEQKESIATEISSEKENPQLQLTLQDDKIMLNGADADIKKVEEMLSRGKLVLTKDSLGRSYISIEKEDIPKVLDEEEQIFFIVEDMPEFPGGDLALRKFIASTIKYPDTAIENGIQGKVYVTFVVTKEGEIANAKIARGVNPVLDKEAIRVVNMQPRWRPGYQRGQAVNVSYTVPINFVLQ